MENNFSSCELWIPFHVTHFLPKICCLFVYWIPGLDLCEVFSHITVAVLIYK